ncbi:hypothetical protein JT26_00145 [Porphyromonas sp. COT-108 OH1349]|nr:hypothetical protein JT26_00145 [Porphyromonas sp. COT-108 OH1349]
MKLKLVTLSPASLTLLLFRSIQTFGRSAGSALIKIFIFSPTAFVVVIVMLLPAGGGGGGVSPTSNFQPLSLAIFLLHAAVPGLPLIYSSFSPSVCPFTSGSVRNISFSVSALSLQPLTHNLSFMLLEIFKELRFGFFEQKNCVKAVFLLTSSEVRELEPQDNTFKAIFLLTSSEVRELEAQPNSTKAVFLLTSSEVREFSVQNIRTKAVFLLTSSEVREFFSQSNPPTFPYTVTVCAPSVYPLLMPNSVTLSPASLTLLLFRSIQIFGRSAGLA